MLEGILNKLRPQSARQALQAESGVDAVPEKELCHCTWTDAQGTSMIVDLLGTDKSQQIALLAYKKTDKDEGSVWLARRDQAGTNSTWLWTDKQLEAASKHGKRIRARINDRPIVVAPIHKDRRTEILTIGKYMGYADAELYERLEAEGFDTTLPDGYRTTWNPYEEQRPTTEPLHNN